MGNSVTNKYTPDTERYKRQWVTTYPVGTDARPEIETVCFGKTLTGKAAGDEPDSNSYPDSLFTHVQA